MSLAPGRLFTTVTRAPLRSLLLAFGLSCACWAGLVLQGVLGEGRRQGPAAEGPLRVSAVPVAPGGRQHSLAPDDLDRLRAAMPDVAVGGVLALEPLELAPPLLPVDELVVVAADSTWLGLAGLRVATGRAFSELDAASPVCLVSQRLARAMGAGVDPIGRHLRVDGSWLTVVGLLDAERDSAPALDIAVPLEAGLLRLAPASRTALDEILVGAREDDDLSLELVQRVLERAHQGGAGWSIEGGSELDAATGAQRNTLALALGLLILASLAVAGLSLQALQRLAREDR